jgi:hypothetical protein
MQRQHLGRRKAMNFSAADTQVLAVASLLGAVYCASRALDIALDAAVASLATLEPDVVLKTCEREGNKTVVTLYRKDGSATEHTTYFIGNFSTVKERTFLWRSDDRGVPREWVRE